MEVVAVDWSGAAQGAAAHIWLAHVVAGELVGLRNGRSRDEVVDDLAALRRATPAGLVAGLDFSFSFPLWFLHQHACTTVEEFWRVTARDGEQWLADCAPPFWGRPRRPRPTLPSHLRLAEQSVSIGGIRPKSVFQIGGAGSVGTGSIRGIPHLLALRAAGFAIWPFDPVSRWTVLEIYPRLLTGPIHKSSRDQRSRYLGESPWPVSPRFADCIVESEDAFDAAISALVMHRHLADLAQLRPSADPRTRMEGDFWRPPKISA